MNEERWKQIEGYPGYWISSNGRVWSEKTQKILSPRGTGCIGGKQLYLTVTLLKNGKTHTKTIHRLVAKAFINNPNNLPLVRHLNDVRTDNRVENLAWGTYEDNTQDAIRNGIHIGLSYEASKKGKDIRRKPVFVRNRITNQKILYESLNEAARALKRSVADIWYLVKKDDFKSRDKFSAEYVLKEDLIMEHINCFPEYHCETEWVDLADGTRKPIVHNYFRGVDVGLGGYIVGEPGIYENVVMLDVQSMHPSSIIALNLFGEYTDRFKQLVDARIAIKHKDFDKARTMLDGKLAPYLDDPSKAKALANALKLAINSVYGMTYQDYEGNPFHDKRNINNIVALRGAIFMKMLQDEMTSRGVKVAAIRTDSIKLVAPSQEDIDFAMNFAKKYSYTFEFECVYEKVCLVTKSDYIAKYMDAKKCQDIYGWIPEENEKMGGRWTSTAAFFSRPYPFKTLFSHEELEFKDICEVKEVSKGAMYLDLNENLPEGEHNYCFIGRVGLFCPIKPGHGGGELVVKREDKNGIRYNAVAGTKGYRWLESEQVKLMSKEDDISMSYFHEMADKVIKRISEYGDFSHFVES